MRVPVSGACFCLLIASMGPLHAQAPSYTKDVRPFLDKYCIECHQGNKSKAGVNLETYESLMKGSKKGRQTVVASQPDKSQVVMSVEGKSGHKMPPRKASAQPTAKEVAVFRAWVESGAKDDTPKQSRWERGHEKNLLLVGAHLGIEMVAHAEADAAMLRKVPPVMMRWRRAPVAMLEAMNAESTESISTSRLQ